MRLFRVYFHIVPQVPAASWRYIWADTPEHAEQLVDALCKAHEEALEAKGFSIACIQEEKIQLFSEYVAAV